MFKENSASKLIEYIQTLPAREQRIIAEGISETKNDPKKKKAAGKKHKKSGNQDRVKKIERFQKFVSKHRLNVPDDFKFDREEANER